MDQIVFFTFWQNGILLLDLGGREQIRPFSRQKQQFSIGVIERNQNTRGWRKLFDMDFFRPITLVE